MTLTHAVAQLRICSASFYLLCLACSTCLLQQQRVDAL